MALAVTARRRSDGWNDGDWDGSRCLLLDDDGLVEGDGEGCAGALSDGGDTERLEGLDGPRFNVNGALVDGCLGLRRLLLGGRDGAVYSHDGSFVFDGWTRVDSVDIGDVSKDGRDVFDKGRCLGV